MKRGIVEQNGEVKLAAQYAFWKVLVGKAEVVTVRASFPGAETIARAAYNAVVESNHAG